MPSRILVVLLFSFPMTGTISPSQWLGSGFGANAAAIRTIPASDELAAPKNDQAPQAKNHRKQNQKETRTQTFTGTVEWEYKPLYWDCDVPNCDHFALFDDATQTNYELDDARAALPYEGKRAKVTGVVNIKTSTIHLLSIEAVK